MENTINKHILEAVVISKLESQITEDINFPLLKRLINDSIKTTNSFNHAASEVEVLYLKHEFGGESTSTIKLKDWSRKW